MVWAGQKWGPWRGGFAGLSAGSQCSIHCGIGGYFNQHKNLLPFLDSNVTCVPVLPPCPFHWSLISVGQCVLLNVSTGVRIQSSSCLYVGEEPRAFLLALDVYPCYIYQRPVAAPLEAASLGFSTLCPGMEALEVQCCVHWVHFS